jgi:succinate-semialdehyde dehydrogenase/glutarate-semialdehyde dehydrogenase
VIKQYDYLSDEEIMEKIQIAYDAFKHWKKTPISSRAKLAEKLAQIMLENKEELAKLNTLEMGMLYKTAL